ncbi:MAG: hypothetical protein ABF586_01085 [Sporolactobacillus sp.]
MLDYHELKKQLLARKDYLKMKLKSDAETATELGSVTDFAGGELSTYDNHPADTATQLYEREKDLAFHKRMQDELKDIDDALTKIENGRYGLDERSGEPIPEERLRALPTARTVISEGAPKHAYKQRPVEESVLIDQEEEGITDFQSNDFDEDNAMDLVTQYNELPLVYDEAPFADENESLGFVEPIEAHAATGIAGYTGDENVRYIPDKEEK